MKETLPRHVAIIMDGNGRWAQRQGRPRVFGHQVGVERVEEIIEVASEIGLKHLTLYAFSKENWQRPSIEIQFLMKLLSHFLDAKLEKLKSNRVVFNAIGHLEDMPQDIRRKIDRNMKETRDLGGLVATFAFSYSSRFEIAQACRRIAREVAAGELAPDAITEETISDRLYTRGLPDPDLLIRTSGEMRISNFLLWQISYTELYVTPRCWPEFGRDEFMKALEDYGRRERRFGRTEPVRDHVRS